MKSTKTKINSNISQEYSRHNVSRVIRFKRLPDYVDDVAATNNSLRQALKRLSEGTDDTPRSWFYEDKPAEWIIQQVSAELDAMRELNNIAEWDLSKSDKFAPQGGSAPLIDRLSSFEEYFQHLERPQIVRDSKWREAKATTAKFLGFNQSGTPLSLEQVAIRGMHENKYFTNSGFPDYTKRKNPQTMHNAITAAENGEYLKYPFTLGTRATMGKTHEEARNIFMAPMATNLAGQRFVLPVMDYLRTVRLRKRNLQGSSGLNGFRYFFTPWEGWEKCQQVISRNWDKGLKFGADYSKMDQHFNIYHALEVFDVIKFYFQRQYWEDLRMNIMHVFHAPVITNLGYVDQDHAMPSGSEWTNFLETVWNLIFNVYMYIKYHLGYDSAMGIGDDQLFILSDWNVGRPDSKRTEKRLEGITNLYISQFEYAGLPGNAEKQEVGFEETGFLQRLLASDWSGLDGKTRAAGVYSLIRNTTSQVYPERYYNAAEWTSDMFALRVIMIAENANQHPLFKWYVQSFIANANKNILEFVRKRDSEIKAVESQAKRIAGFIPTYNQEKQDQSILSFDCFKLLRELV
nr:RNA-dependent RNA polymerase [Marmot picobirnavirus]